METQLSLSLLAGAAAGGFINGFAGFGTALLALGFFLQSMAPTQAVAVVVALSVCSGLPAAWQLRAAILAQRRRLLRFVLPALAGIPFGVAALARIDARVLELVVGALLLLYGGFFSLRRSLPTLERALPGVDLAVGFAGGLLGGAASLSGALPSLWCSLRPWPKVQTRSLLQAFNLCVLGLTAGALLWRGAYSGQTLLLCALALPVALLFAQLGMALFRRLADAQFRRCLVGLCLLSGLILLVRALASP